MKLEHALYSYYQMETADPHLTQTGDQYILSAKGNTRTYTLIKDETLPSVLGEGFLVFQEITEHPTTEWIIFLPNEDYESLFNVCFSPGQHRLYVTGYQWNDWGKLWVPDRGSQTTHWQTIKHLVYDALSTFPAYRLYFATETITLTEL